MEISYSRITIYVTDKIVPISRPIDTNALCITKNSVGGFVAEVPSRIEGTSKSRNNPSSSRILEYGGGSMATIASSMGERHLMKKELFHS